MCKQGPENSDHMLLHCSVAASLCRRLFRATEVSLDNSASCVALLSERYKFFGGKKRVWCTGAKEICYIGNHLGGVDGGVLEVF